MEEEPAVGGRPIGLMPLVAAGAMAVLPRACCNKECKAAALIDGEEEEEEEEEDEDDDDDDDDEVLRCLFFLYFFPLLRRCFFSFDRLAFEECFPLFLFLFLVVEHSGSAVCCCLRWPAPLPDITSPTAPGAPSIPPLSHKAESAINGHALGGVKPPVAAAAVHATAVGTLPPCTLPRPRYTLRRRSQGHHSQVHRCTGPTEAGGCWALGAEARIFSGSGVHSNHHPKILLRDARQESQRGRFASTAAVPRAACWLHAARCTARPIERAAAEASQPAKPSQPCLLCDNR
eukprot:COSAG01_NODE_295_length_19292_cov_726.304538_5_plen_289_part_00